MSLPAAQRKAILRRELSGRLLGLSPAERIRAAQLVTERALDLPELRGARHLLVCLSFGVELETGPLVERWRSGGRTLYVPRADRHDRTLHIHPYPCDLVELSFGLRQPPPGAPELSAVELDATLDAALVLGLGFDRRGYRLGYGSGYFDRFLAGRRPFPAIGLAFDCQLVDELPVEAHDVAMSRIVTDREVVRPAAAGPRA